MKKSSDALRTISEVATDLDIPKHVLRFWESKFTQIRPMKRGGGRRYYRPADIELLKAIRHLLYGEGFTIRGVQQIFKREGIDYVKSFANVNGDEATPLLTPKTVEKENPAEKITNSHIKVALKKDSFTKKLDPKQKVLVSILDEVEECRKILA
ncbi:MAG: MerR family transcriptional regulator [Rhizobiales bacterium]|nr:MerR family transcriptional regulator [Hyphomicrobiales bacterium]